MPNERCAVQAVASLPVKCNIVGSKQKRDQLHELCKETGAHLLHTVWSQNTNYSGLRQAIFMFFE